MPVIVHRSETAGLSSHGRSRMVFLLASHMAFSSGFRWRTLTTLISKRLPSREQSPGGNHDPDTDSSTEIADDLAVTQALPCALDFVFVFQRRIDPQVIENRGSQIRGRDWQ